MMQQLSRLASQLAEAETELGASIALLKKWQQEAADEGQEGMAEGLSRAILLLQNGV